MTRPDLFAPALAQAGLAPSRVIYVECGDEKSLLACFEEGLRYSGLGAVVGETARLSMTASRRLQLAAESSGVIGLAIRRWRRQTEAADFGMPSENLVEFSDGVIVAGRHVCEGTTIVLTIAPYKTARGTEIGEKSWIRLPDSTKGGWKIKARALQDATVSRCLPSTHMLFRQDDRHPIGLKHRYAELKTPECAKNGPS